MATIIEGQEKKAKQEIEKEQVCAWPYLTGPQSEKRLVRSLERLLRVGRKARKPRDGDQKMQECAQAACGSR